MVDKILNGIPHKETRFLKPPDTTYAIYNDYVNRRGADSVNLLSYHSVSIELYEHAPDPEIEALIESRLDALAIEFDKQARYWISEEQLYQVIYEFDYYEKGGL